LRKKESSFSEEKEAKRLLNPAQVERFVSGDEADAWLIGRKE
jgi:hypothetical protein